jgi:hypothetical protein
MIALHPSDIRNVLDNTPSDHKIMGKITEQNLRDLYRYQRNNTLQCFEFGQLPRKVTEQAIDDAAPIADAGLMTLPYNEGFYRVDIEDTNGTGNYNGLLLFWGHDPDKKSTEIYCLIKNPQSGDLLGLSAKHWPLSVNHRGLSREVLEVEQQDLDLLTSLGIVFIAESMPYFLWPLTVILQAKGVGRVCTAPSAKLNAARARKHLPLLPYVTRVDGQLYAQAALNGAPSPSGSHGTHASPRPHLRRAHLRTLTNSQGNTRQVHVCACVVNWDGTTLTRDHYEVKAA